jgi:hypothetical protein
MCAVLYHVTGSGRFVPGNKEINSRGSGVYSTYIPEMETKM